MRTTEVFVKKGNRTIKIGACVAKHVMRRQQKERLAHRRPDWEQFVPDAVVEEGFDRDPVPDSPTQFGGHQESMSPFKQYSWDANADFDARRRKTDRSWKQQRRTRCQYR